MHMLYSNYMVLFTLVDLQSQCMGQVSEPVNICIGKLLKKRLNPVYKYLICLQVLPVSLFVPYGLLTRKLKCIEKNIIGMSISHGRSNQHANFYFKRSGFGSVLVLGNAVYS